MGYYIETGSAKGKGQFLVANHGAVEVSRQEFAQLDPSEHGLVIVRDNFIFEAAGFMFDRHEMMDWLSCDPAPFTYYKMDLGKARQLSGYRG